jgi:hypothetical protein
MRPRESAVVWVLATPSSHGAAVRVRRGKLRVHIRDFAVGGSRLRVRSESFSDCEVRSRSRSLRVACIHSVKCIALR